MESIGNQNSIGMSRISSFWLVYKLLHFWLLIDIKCPYCAKNGITFKLNAFNANIITICKERTPMTKFLHENDRKELNKPHQKKD